MEKDKVHDSYYWISYKQFENKMFNVLHGFYNLLGTEKETFVGICGPNIANWLLVDVACVMSQTLVSIPIHTNADVSMVAQIVSVTNLTCVVCTWEWCVRMLLPNLEKLQSLVWIVVMDEPSVKDKLSKEQSEVTSHLKGILSIEEVARIGKEHEKDPKKGISPRKGTDLLTISFTSGSTGTPKGTILNEDMWFKEVIAKGSASVPLFVTLSHAPLAHTTDRKYCWSAMLSGGRIGMLGGDISNFFHDLQVVRPVVLYGVPRTWVMIRDEFFNLLKIEYEKRGIVGSDQKVKEDLIKKFYKQLGGRVRLMVMGGAPTPPALKRVIYEILPGTWLAEAYGMTECGAIANDGKIVTGVQVKLLDCPEHGYLNSDLPNPRGEICVKKETTTPGYFKESSADLYTEDGYFRTGDIGELIVKKNEIRIIDRCKNVFKLAQGKYVCPEKLEIIYSSSKYVNQIFIHGNGEKDYIIAVVVLNSTILESWGLNTTGEIQFTLEHEKEVLEDLIAIAREDGSLQPFEIVRAVILEADPWTPDNGLTATLKLSRRKLIDRYSKAMNKIYESKPIIKVREITTVQDKIMHLYSTVLDYPGEITENSILAELGADSIVVVTARERLLQLFPFLTKENLTIPDVMSQPISVLATFVEQNEKSPNSVTVAGVKIDFKKEVIHHMKILRDFASSQPLILPVEEMVSSVLVTGSTGFVGRNLVNELVTSYFNNKEPATVFCLVRANNNNEAFSRFETIFKNIFGEKNGTNIRKFEEWQNKPNVGIQIVPISGYLDMEGLGFDPKMWDFLAAHLDAIFHCGADVHHIKPYNLLKKTNVQGTVEILKLACHTKRKILHHLSTMSVLYDRYAAKEDDPLEDLQLDKSSGYRQSKWVSECVVQEAAKELSIPTYIYRLGMMSWNTTNGDCNIEDWFNRLLLTCLLTLCCPGINASYNVLPVDFACKSILDIAKTKRNKIVNHIVNCADPWKLFDIIDGLQKFGFRIRQVLIEEWVSVIKSHPSPLPLQPLMHNFSSIANYQTDMRKVSCTNSNLSTNFLAAPFTTDYLIHYLQSHAIRAILSPLDDETII
eukprot:Phypoly_transcript_01085.p1 GENE.Phypoly_transcript_01085~~Phypoly_transcript_01085.p1  ORF type:complete len:1212 (+),score=174.21 Phypoly_transcript_01085:429-3638(+)